MSSWIFSPAAPAIRIDSSGSGREEEPRASSAMLSGQASIAPCIRRSAYAGLAPRFQTGPKSCATIVVIPAASAWSTIRGDSRCTCVSIAPAVAIRPSPE